MTVMQRISKFALINRMNFSNRQRSVHTEDYRDSIAGMNLKDNHNVEN